MVCIFCVFLVSVLYSAESALNFRLPPGCKKIGPSCISISSPLVWSTQKWTDENKIEEWQVRYSDQMFSRISQTWWAQLACCTCNRNHGLHAARCFRTRWTSHRGHDEGWGFEQSRQQSWLWQQDFWRQTKLNRRKHVAPSIRNVET